MGRIGTQDVAFWGEVLRKEERHNEPGFVGRRAGQSGVTSQAMEAAFGKRGWDDEGAFDAGEQAAIQEELRQATVARAILEATEKREARQAKVQNPRRRDERWSHSETPRLQSTSRSASSWASSTFGSTWSGHGGSTITTMLGKTGVDVSATYVSGDVLTSSAQWLRGDEDRTAARTEKFMKTSPTYTHSDELDLFVGAKKKRQQSSNAARGSALATAACTDKNSMVAAGTATCRDVLHSAREASRPARMRSTEAGRRRLQQLSGCAAMAAQKGGHA